MPSKVDGLMVEVVLDEPGTPPQAGDTVSDPAGNDDRVLQSLSLGAAQGWWLIEGQLIL
ncbi:hypothetical protein V3W47_07940 [Deinococcus sp. YIM 134068]|uniref:Uncharacterized protein n=1 Tax=Deinococcus budaensis TaxID=1665626 RepID=A0A7W8GFI2_9DEIO|nr:hypothetical protein [Deinococcus budaensis]MBB5234353.1 hypothetical protein [Deinococcus budaensis]